VAAHSWHAARLRFTFDNKSILYSKALQLYCGRKASWAGANDQDINPIMHSKSVDLLARQYFPSSSGQQAPWLQSLYQCRMTIKSLASSLHGAGTPAQPVQTARRDL
jgi:hypothetical protein